MLYVYRGLPGEQLPRFRGDYTHIVIAEEVICIPPDTFRNCHNVTTVTMFDNVVKIGACSFASCARLKFIKLSKALGAIGRFAFSGCWRMECYCIPETVASIARDAFTDNDELRFIRFPRNLSLVEMPKVTRTKLWDKVISRFGIQVLNVRSIRVARRFHINIRMIEETRAELRKEVGQLLQGNQNGNRLEDISTGRETGLEQMGSDIRLLNAWIHYHMAEYPLHMLCFNASVTPADIDTFPKKHASIIDRWHKTSPLHMLSMNPHAPASAFELLFDMWKWSIFKKDNKKNTPLEYAEVNNVAGLLAMIKCLCEYRNGTVIPSAIPKKPWLGRLRKRLKKSNY